MATKEKKENVIFYRDWWEMLKGLPAEERCKYYEAIMAYAFENEVPQDKIIAIATYLIRASIDRANEKYMAAAERNSVNARKGGAPKGNQNARKKPKTTETTETTGMVEKQLKQPDKDKDKDNDKDKEKDNLFFKESDDSSSTCEVDPSAAESCNMEKLADFFNDTLEESKSTIPRVKRITPRRRKTVGARCREYGKEAVMKMIRNAAKSDFLNGRNNKGWQADFDWLFLPNNFPKVLEGNYDNNNRNNNTYGNYNSEYHQPQRFGNNGYPVKGKADFDCGLIMR